mgnify:FL=1
MTLCGGVCATCLLRNRDVLDERKRLKLMKAGSEDTYYLVDSENSADHNKLVRSRSELPPAASDIKTLTKQPSSGK